MKPEASSPTHDSPDDPACLAAAAARHLASPMVVMRIGPARQFFPVYCVSPNVHRKFGYAQEHMLDHRFRLIDIVHPDDYGRIVRDTRPYCDAGSNTFSHDYRIATRSGDYRWVRDYTRITRNREGEPVFADIHLIDISAWKESGTGNRRTRTDGLISLCANCKSVHDRETGKWNQVESLLARNGAKVSHGICPSCAEQLYPGLLD